jgi:hypothetical protein
MVGRGLVGRGGVVCVLCVVCVVVAGCGGSGGSGGGGLPGGVVAVFGSRVVSLALLEHWTRAEDALATEAEPGVPNEAWVRPDPPLYKSCVARLEQPGTPASATLVARLKGVCRGSYRTWQRKALSFLLRQFWEEQSASEDHIAPTNSELEHEYQVYVAREYGGGLLQKMLADTGLSVADERMRIKGDMLEERLFVYLGRQARADAGNRRALAALQARRDSEYARLLSETTCSAWILVEECREYHGVMRENVKS